MTISICQQSIKELQGASDIWPSYFVQKNENNQVKNFIPRAVATNIQNCRINLLN